jgi:hypothetical protein
MQAQIGSVVAFAGKGIVSAIIDLATFQLPDVGISHVGILAEYKGDVILFESTTLNDQPCLIQGKRVEASSCV